MGLDEASSGDVGARNETSENGAVRATGDEQLLLRDARSWVIRLITLWFRSSELQHRRSSPRGTRPKFGWKGVGSLFLAKKLQYL